MQVDAETCDAHGGGCCSQARRNRSMVVRASDEKAGMSVDTDEILKTLQEKVQPIS